MDAPSIGVLSWKSIILPLKVILQSCAAVFVLIQYKNAHKKISLCILVFYVQKKVKLEHKVVVPLDKKIIDNDFLRNYIVNYYYK